MTEIPSCKEIYLAFQRMAFSSFGGALPWSRIVLVEEKNWLTPDEYAEVLSLCQFIPGPNIVNVSIVVGERFRGWRGSLAAFAGLLIVPFFLTLAMGFLYFKFKYIPHLKGTIEGIGAVAAGLMIVTSLHMILNLLKKNPWFIFFSLISFMALLWIPVHSFIVLFVLAPVAVYCALKVKSKS